MTNARKRDVKAWIEASRYDLDTAKAMLQTHRYLYVLFMCQQSLEKLLKGHVTAKTREFPPRIHNLMRLEELTDLKCTPEEKALLERLSLYYIQTRYPLEIQALAKDLLQEAEVLWKKLRRRLAQKT
jgi:HEPN domain-containing protein